MHPGLPPPVMFGISREPPDRQALAAVAAGATEKPLYFNLVVHKAVGVHLGIDVSCTSASAFVKDGIFVTRVEDDGVVAAWNAHSQEPYRVRAGDFVFQVNNVHGDSIRMMQEMQARKTLTMHVLRTEGLSLRGEDSNVPHEQDDAAEDLDPEPEPVVHQRQITARERHEAPPLRPGSEAAQAQPTSPDDGLEELLVARLSTMSDQAFAEFTDKERRKAESVAPSAAPSTMTVLGVEMVVKNTFLEVAEEEEGVAAKLQRCSTAPGSLAAWSQRCLSDGPKDSDIESELSARGAPSAASHSWSGCDARRVARDRRAAGEVSSGAISKKCVQCGDEDDDQSPCSTTCTPYSTMTSWTTDSEEDYDYELAQFETPRRLSIASFAMDTPVRAGGAGALPTAARASASAEEAAPQAPPQAPPRRAPQIVTTIMVQNLKRNVTRDGFMLSLDSQGFAGKYDFVHLPKSFGIGRNNGCAFVNFTKLEDAEEFARSIARIKGSKMRAVPAAVQGSANAAKASSKKKTRIRSGSCRPLVVGGHGQDVPLHA